MEQGKAADIAYKCNECNRLFTKLETISCGAVCPKCIKPLSLISEREKLALISSAFSVNEEQDKEEPADKPKISDDKAEESVDKAEEKSEISEKSVENSEEANENHDEAADDPDKEPDKPEAESIPAINPFSFDNTRFMEATTPFSQERSDLSSAHKKVVAELWLPSKNAIDVQGIQQFIASLPRPISLEYCANGSKRYMLVRGADSDVRYTAGKIASLYPAASLHILPEDPVRKEVRNSGYMQEIYYTYSGDDYLPIKIWETYADGDPVHTLLSSIIGLEEGESLWIQFQMIDKGKPEWLKNILRRIKAEQQHGFVINTEMENSSQNAGAYTSTPVNTVDLKQATINTMYMIGWLFVFVILITGRFVLAGVAALIMLVMKQLKDKYLNKMDDSWYSSDLSLIQEKVMHQDEFTQSAIRVAAFSPSRERTDDLARRVTLALNQYSIAGGNSFRQDNCDVVRQINPDKFLDSDDERVMWMADSEISGLWHIPIINESVAPGLIPVRGVEMRSPDAKDVEGFYQIGEYLLPTGERRPVNVNHKMLKHNMFLIGKPGTGKTTMMEHLALAAMRDEAESSSIIVIDPHGDMFNRLVGAVPPGKRDKVVLMDFGDPEYVVPYNPLDVKSSHLTIDQSAQLIVDIGKSLWSDFWGPRMQVPLQRGTMAIAAHNFSSPLGDAQGLSMLPSLLNADPKARDIYLDTIVDGREKSVLKRYFDNDYKNLKDFLRDQIIQPVLSKAYRFEESPMLEIFSAPQSVLNPADIISGKKILLVNTRMSMYGSELSDFLGSLIVNIILREISRQGESAAEKRFPVLLLIDEFQTFRGVPWQELLAQLRKWGGRTILGTQSFASLKEVDPALLGIIMSGVYSLLSFTVNGEDATYLSEHELSEKFGGPPADTLISMDPYSCYARFMREDNKLSRPFFFLASPPIPTSNNVYQEVMELRKGYAVPKEQAITAAMGYLTFIETNHLMSAGNENGKNEPDSTGAVKKDGYVPLPANAASTETLSSAAIDSALKSVLNDAIEDVKKKESSKSKSGRTKKAEKADDVEKVKETIRQDTQEFGEMDDSTSELDFS